MQCSARCALAARERICAQCPRLEARLRSLMFCLSRDACACAQGASMSLRCCDFRACARQYAMPALLFMITTKQRHARCAHRQRAQCKLAAGVHIGSAVLLLRECRAACRFHAAMRVRARGRASLSRAFTLANMLVCYSGVKRLPEICRWRAMNTEFSRHYFSIFCMSP